jgi:hypothetical protein
MRTREPPNLELGSKNKNLKPGEIFDLHPGGPRGGINQVKTLFFYGSLRIFFGTGAVTFKV